jgi:hypothetical protein
MLCYQPIPDGLTLDPANQSKPQEKIYDPRPHKDSLNQPEPNSSPLSRSIHEYGNLPPSFPQRAPLCCSGFLASFYDGNFLLIF